MFSIRNLWSRAQIFYLQLWRALQCLYIKEVTTTQLPNHSYLEYSIKKLKYLNYIIKKTKKKIIYLNQSKIYEFWKILELLFFWKLYYVYLFASLVVANSQSIFVLNQILFVNKIHHFLYYSTIVNNHFLAKMK